MNGFNYKINNLSEYRPKAWEKVYKWHLGQVDNTDPSKKSAIYVVHGMGRQAWAETSAVLRAGIEDALESIPKADKSKEILPAPFIQDGYWANYDDLEKSFPDEWKRFEESKYSFFTMLWKSRSISGIKTFWWFIRQLPRLVIDPRVIVKESPLAWLIYFMLLFIVPPLFIIFFLFFPSVLSRIFNDVRLYCSPRGIIEKAIVQRIDYRVGESLLKLIGLDWNFRNLKIYEQFKVDGKPVIFDRVFFVAHSLGTVISYNVMSDLIERADYFAVNGDAEQQEGVNKFWNSLQRFITMGSPLDKIAVLFGKKVLRPWPERMFKSDKKTINEKDKTLRTFWPNWWVNYFHFLDPVSGALSQEDICPQNQKPNNFHLNKFFYMPGLAHIKYWKDKTVLTYLLSRFFGKERIEFPKKESMSATLLTWFAIAGYFTWLCIILIPVALVLWSLGVF